MATILVTGGTGFLAHTVIYLVHRGYQVAVIGRRPERFNALKFLLKDKADRVFPLICDYTSKTELDEAFQKLPEVPEASIHWIHSSFENGPLEMATRLNNRFQPHRFIHVRGSAAAAPEADRDLWKIKLGGLKAIHYQQVILGFHIDKSQNSSRWLTQHELTEGMIHALNHPDQDHVVGDIEPWELRP